MVTPNDHMGCPVVPPDDGMPEGFTGTCEAHRQRQQAQQGKGEIIFFLVDTFQLSIRVFPRTNARVFPYTDL
jgi:hypothetical protein